MSGQSPDQWKKFRTVGDQTGYRRQPVTLLQHACLLIASSLVFMFLAYLMPGAGEAAELAMFLLWRLASGVMRDDTALIAAPAIAGGAVGFLVGLVICGRLWLRDRVEKKEDMEAARGKSAVGARPGE